MTRIVVGARSLDGVGRVLLYRPALEITAGSREQDPAYSVEIVGINRGGALDTFD